MKDYVTGIDFNHYALNEYELAAAGHKAPKHFPYATLRAQRRHVYDWEPGRYKPASTHAEVLERYGFQVTSGGRR